MNGVKTIAPPTNFRCPYLSEAQVSALTKDNPCRCPSLRHYNLCQMAEMAGNYNKHFTIENLNKHGVQANGESLTPEQLAQNYAAEEGVEKDGTKSFKERHKLMIEPPAGE